MLTARSTNDDNASKQLKTEFLTEMSRINNDNELIVVIGATNRRNALDKALIGWVAVLSARLVNGDSHGPIAGSASPILCIVMCEHDDVACPKHGRSFTRCRPLLHMWPYPKLAADHLDCAMCRCLRVYMPFCVHCLCMPVHARCHRFHPNTLAAMVVLLCLQGAFQA